MQLKQYFFANYYFLMIFLLFTFLFLHLQIWKMRIIPIMKSKALFILVSMTLLASCADEVQEMEQ